MLAKMKENYLFSLKRRLDNISTAFQLLNLECQCISVWLHFLECFLHGLLIQSGGFEKLKYLVDDRGEIMRGVGR